jgi:hypothetical protein
MPIRMRFVALSLLLVFALALGCAPVQSFRPADGLMDGKTGEIGGGGAVIGPRPYVDERAHGVGQLWISKKVDKRVTLTGMGAFDVAAAALGGGLRVDVWRNRRAAVAVEGELGFAWGALLLPASVRLIGDARLYTGPRLGSRGINWAVDLPIGMSVPINRSWVVRAEYSSSWVEVKSYQHRHMMGMALSYQY